MRILIVEDEHEIADGLRSILKKEGYSVDVAYDGGKGLEDFLSGIYDLVLLDVMLPVKDGIEVLKAARDAGFTTPVIILTARFHMDDKIMGLDSGADDYITKPFDVEELLARIRARLRNDSTEIHGIIRAYDIWLEQSTFKLHGGQKSVGLAKKEYQLLEYFMANKGHILQRDMLISRIWGLDSEPDYNHLDVYISFLRKKLKFVGARAEIVTKKGIGYSLQSGGQEQ